MTTATSSCSHNIGKGEVEWDTLFKIWCKIIYKQVVGVFLHFLREEKTSNSHVEGKLHTIRYNNFYTTIKI